MNTMDSALGCAIESILSQLGYGEFVKRTNDMLRDIPHESVTCVRPLIIHMLCNKVNPRRANDVTEQLNAIAAKRSARMPDPRYSELFRHLDSLGSPTKDEVDRGWNYLGTVKIVYY